MPRRKRNVKVPPTYRRNPPKATPCPRCGGRREVKLLRDTRSVVVCRKCDREKIDLWVSAGVWQ